MRITVIGETEPIGSKVVLKLQSQGHEVVAASPNSGVNTLTGERLAKAVQGAAVVIDVCKSPCVDDDATLEFFKMSTSHVIDASAREGVGHLVALSVVGSGRPPNSVYLRAKTEQEKLIAASAIPYSIVRATQFFESLERIADEATCASTVVLPPVLFRPVAADDVAVALSTIALRSPSMGTVEVVGPEQFLLNELVKRDLTARGDLRLVVGNPLACRLGAVLGERSLLHSDDSVIGTTRYEDWCTRSPDWTR
jgi:uncharacterized protein YbjT (DUF2867 family)